MVSVPRLVQPDVLLALGLAQEMLKLLSSEDTVRVAEVEEGVFQLPLRRGADMEAAELGQAWGIDVEYLDVGALPVLVEDADGGYGGEAVEEGARTDLGGSLREGRAPFLGLGGGRSLLPPSSR